MLVVWVGGGLVEWLGQWLGGSVGDCVVGWLGGWVGAGWLVSCLGDWLKSKKASVKDGKMRVYATKTKTNVSAL